MPNITSTRQVDLDSGHITMLRWSLDGRYLAIPTESGSILIFDIDSERVAQTLGPHSGEVTAVGWDHKAELLLTGSVDRSIGLWELKSGMRLSFVIEGHTEPVHSVEWTDEGAFAMTCSADRVRALDGCCLLPGWTQEAENMVNQCTGLTLASCSRRSAFLLGMAAENGSLLVLVSLLSAALLDRVRMDEPIRSLTWSPGNELLAVAAGEKILLFRANQEGFEGAARELTRHTPHVHALAFSGDGRLLASRDAHGLKIWNIEDASLIARWTRRSRRFPPNVRLQGLRSIQSGQYWPQSRQMESHFVFWSSASSCDGYFYRATTSAVSAR